MSKFEKGDTVVINTPGEVFFHGSIGEIWSTPRKGSDYSVKISGEIWDFREEELEAANE